MTPSEVKAWRAHWHISQARLAQLLGINIRTVTHWEGGTAPTPAYLDLALETLARREAATLMQRAAAATSSTAARSAS